MSKEVTPVNAVIKAGAIDHLDNEECTGCMARCMNHALGNETVRTDREILEASMDLANTAGLVNNLMQTLSDTMIKFVGQMDEVTAKRKELYELEVSIAKKTKKLAELEGMDKLKKPMSIGQKVGAALVTIIVVLGSFFTGTTAN